MRTETMCMCLRLMSSCSHINDIDEDDNNYLWVASEAGIRIFERNNVKKDAVRRPLSYPKNGTKIFAK